MFNEVRTLIDRAASSENQSSVQQAAESHVQQMDPSQLQQHVQNAADNANQKGDTSAAQMLEQIVSNARSGQSIQQSVISVVSSNPQILEHFAPEFAKSILSRV